MFTIQVPASSANIGPGFDSLGVAIRRYLTLEVTRSQSWVFENQSEFLPNVTDYRDHFIYQVAQQIADQYGSDLPPCKVLVKSDIPLARGLGSSASAIIAGIELANQLGQLQLTTEKKLQLATDIEGHPDNVTPALLGGFTTTYASDDHVDYVKIPHLEVDIALFIPHTELKTEEARNVLPNVYEDVVATKASSACNVMLTALLSGDLKLAGKMMEKDLFHEPYRKKLIPNYDLIKKIAKQHGAYGTVISGAGPTMMSFIPQNNGQAFTQNLTEHFPAYDLIATSIDKDGLRITH